MNREGSKDSKTAHSAPVKSLGKRRAVPANFFFAPALKQLLLSCANACHENTLRYEAGKGLLDLSTSFVAHTDIGTLS